MRLSTENRMQIGDLADKLGISTRTIRLYEKLGLVDPAERTDGRVRHYGKEDVKRFKFILKLKELGLTLEEMRELADLFNREQRGPESIMPRLVQLLDNHLMIIQEKIGTLQSLEREISAYRQRIIDQFHPR